jgi:alpha-ketoglutarate-dependent taurine dioxygenase
MYRIENLKPFGIVMHCVGQPRSIDDIPANEMQDLINQYHLIVMRGFSSKIAEDLVTYANRYGPLLKWEFGELLNLRVENKPANHLFGAGRVEMHWDGAYLTDVPRYCVFQCLDSSEDGDGGETLFTDTVKLMAEASPEERRQWAKVVMHYSSDKVAHYGGDVTLPLVSVHQYSGQANLRFVEPFNEDNQEINPIAIRVVNGVDQVEEGQFLRSFTERIYGDDVMYRHRWQKGDYMIFDNSALLHGRSKMRSNVSRHLHRIHILNGKAFESSRKPFFIGAKTTDIHENRAVATISIPLNL